MVTFRSLILICRVKVLHSFRLLRRTLRASKCGEIGVRAVRVKIGSGFTSVLQSSSRAS